MLQRSRLISQAECQGHVERGVILVVLQRSRLISQAECSRLTTELLIPLIASTEPPDFSGGMPPRSLHRRRQATASTEPPDFSGGMRGGAASQLVPLAGFNGAA